MAADPNVGPYKLSNPDLVVRFLDAISKGCSYKIACGYAGVTYAHFRQWMRKGEEYMEANPDKEFDIYAKFHHFVRAAEAKAACKWLDKIEDASESQWQAAAWKLERRYPKDYGKDREEIDKKLDENNAELKSIREIMTKCIKTE